MKSHRLTHVAIVADDLTSATDGAAPFLAKGYVSQIIRTNTGTLHSPIVAIDTDSRASNEADAAVRTKAAVEMVRDCSILLKTIDSTLRGHARSEITAAFSASGRNRIVTAPAFPEAGRATRDGIQFVHGTPVSQSDYARDPVHPARTSRIADLIDPDLGRPAVVSRHAPLGAVEQARALILDADSQDVLNAQVGRIPDPDGVLWVGSPGLAIALAALVPNAPDLGPIVSARGKRLLIIAGSANLVTHGQCKVLADNGIPVVQDLAKAPCDAPVVCLRAPQDRQTDAGAVLAALVDPAASALSQKRFDAVIATGGETMAAILDRLGILGLTLTTEVEPGFPVGMAKLADGTPLAIAMKAGGFGSPATLLRAANILTSIEAAAS